MTTCFESRVEGLRMVEEHVGPDDGPDASFDERLAHGVHVVDVKRRKRMLGGIRATAGALSQGIGLVRAQVEILDLPEDLQILVDPFSEERHDVRVPRAILVDPVRDFRQRLVPRVLQNVFAMADRLEQGDRLEPEPAAVGEDLLELGLGESVRGDAFRARFPFDVVLDLPDDGVVAQACQHLQLLLEVMPLELGDVHVDVEALHPRGRGLRSRAPLGPPRMPLPKA